MKKVVPFPLSQYRRMKNHRDPRYVPCMVSGRWLQFPKESAGHFGGGEFISLDVMTETEPGVHRKLCDLVVTREELQRALDSVKTPPEK